VKADKGEEWKEKTAGLAHSVYAIVDRIPTVFRR